jgi:hypothetical protein
VESQISRKTSEIWDPRVRGQDRFNLGQEQDSLRMEEAPKTLLLAWKSRDSAKRLLPTNAVESIPWLQARRED